jgi:glycosyltransferase involved in cell wall biosynthesis
MLNVLNYASAITTFSLEVKTYLEGLGLGEKVHLIPNFIDVDFFSRPSHLKKNNDQKVVMVSRLDEHKDPLFVIHAFKQVSKVNPQATLLIVGYGSLYEAANDLVKKLGLESVVKFAGNSHANEIKNFLWTHGIFIATRSSYLSVLEAWAAGLAVIAVKDGILGEVITENQNGLLIEQGNITQLADKLSRVIDDPVLRQTLIVNGKRSVKMYDIRTVGGQIADIYRSLA